MNTEFLRNFIVLTEERNISRAAARLFISRSALNRQLLQAEQLLGHPLFKRLGTSLELTYLGSVYLDMANQVLSTINRGQLLMSSICEGTGGEISFGISPSFAVDILGKVLPVFHKTYPGITIKLTQEDSSLLARMLHDGKLDFAVISSFDATPDLKTKLLRDGEIVLCAPPDHPKAHLAGLENAGKYIPCELRWFKDDYFCMQGPSSPIYDLLQDIFNQANFAPRVSVIQATRPLIKELVSRSVACAFLIDFYTSQESEFVKFGLNPRVYYSLVLAYPDTYVPSPAEQYFIDLVCQYFSAQTENYKLAD